MQPYLQFAIETAEKAGLKLLDNFGENPPITRGTPKEVKSLFDEIADEIIRDEIEKAYPDHSYVTEESGLVEKDSEYRWIIDPLDGTGNYVNSNPFFAISISLWQNNRPIVAVIEAPLLQERYTAVVNEGAFVTNFKTGERMPMKVSETRELSQAYITFCEGGVQDRSKVVQSIQKIYPQVKDMRKLGSAALEMAWVALGRADAYLTHDISLWDIAAGVLLVQEAGGRLQKFDGSSFLFEEMFDQDAIDIVALNQSLHFPGL